MSSDQRGQLLAADIEAVLSRVRHLTMVPESELHFSWMEAVRLADSPIAGAIVECGTWKGGCAFGMALCQRAAFGEVRRRVWMFDSFEGLPAATLRDGPDAIAYQADTQSPLYFDNCRADYQEVITSAVELGLGRDECHIVRGWFETTIPLELDSLRASGIAVLRIDADWYDPVHYVLEMFAPLVTDGGVIIIDDYYTWSGCTQAVHDYLSRTKKKWQIRSSPGEVSAHIVVS
jgi:O-methyltransferase